MPTSRPNLSIQTGSLWASGDNSTFTGTGGPYYFDPFLSEFYGTVSSVGLANEPFQDTVYDVDAGDQVSFVIAIQNFGPVAGYDLKVRDVLPVGFTLLDPNLTVTDGAGNDLAFSGDLFDPAGGLTVTPPIGAYDDNSGANVILLTFTAAATNSLALPGATVTNSAQIVSYAASHGGANLAASNPAPLSATTPVQTGTFEVVSTPNQSAAPLVAGRTASFDIKVTLPEGSVSDFRIDESLPQIGSSWLQLVSAEIVSIGSHLTASAPLIVQPDGSVRLGTVVDAFDNLVTPADDITVRVTVRGAGATAGTGTIDTTVSTADPNGGQRISRTITNTVTLDTPDSPPAIGGTSNAQFATSSALVLPFQMLNLADADADQVQTLTIHLSDRSLGSLSAPAGLATNAAGDYVLAGTVAAAQALARTLVFTPSAGAAGIEVFGLTMDDGFGGVASGQATLTLASGATDANAIHFPISPQTVLTSTATGSSTYTQVETYSGALSNLGTQFLYDGDTTLAIVAQQSGMLISSRAEQTAVQLHGGTNVVDVKQGSGFVVGGAGADTFIMHADQAQTTWHTIVDFNVGDSLILYGFDGATSAKWWTDGAGASGYIGATLRIDVDGNGSIDSSVTFAGKSVSDTNSYTTQVGSVGGSGYLSISRM